MSQLCKDCPHFYIRCEYENEYNWGLAECSKYNLVTDFRSKKKFKTLECVVVDGKKQEDKA
jgi:hypothetical protein